jgi:hypothetical protein
MYLSAERLALANQAVLETFEQSSVAWQAIPHWDTGDPGQTMVSSDVSSVDVTASPPTTGPLGANPIAIDAYSVSFYLTVAQAMAPKPDALLAAVLPRAVVLARLVDTKLIHQLLVDPQPDPGDIPDATTDNELLKVLIKARALAETSGYRAPSCLFADTAGLTLLSQFSTGIAILGGLLDESGANSAYRVDKVEADGGAPAAADTGRILVLGRRQRIPQGGAPSASAGEEPVDLAVSVFPTLEVVGETTTGYIELAVRTRLAVRVKDKYGVVGVEAP